MSLITDEVIKLVSELVSLRDKRDALRNRRNELELRLEQVNKLLTTHGASETRILTELASKGLCDTAVAINGGPHGQYINATTSKTTSIDGSSMIMEGSALHQQLLQLQELQKMQNQGHAPMMSSSSRRPVSLMDDTNTLGNSPMPSAPTSISDILTPFGRNNAQLRTGNINSNQEWGMPPPGASAPPRRTVGNDIGENSYAVSRAPLHNPY
jgi:hypothetical protein